MYEVEDLISKLEKDIKKIDIINKLNNIIKENGCILKLDLSIRFANITGIILILLNY
jgi:hypothetical protein